MNRGAFGAIELISVLAILAILTALVLPRVLQTTKVTQAQQTVNEAHLTQVVATLQALQPAITAHLAQFGSLASRNGTPLPFSETYDNFGQVLLTEGLLERPFELSLGTNATLRLVKLSQFSRDAQVDGSNGIYDLDGDGKSDTGGAGYILDAVIPDVREVEARALNDRLDGPRLGAGEGKSDFVGRVIYPTAGPSGMTTVHIYLQHK
jgi:type II secretory pathway pseudopilin PulG